MPSTRWTYLRSPAAITRVSRAVSLVSPTWMAGIRSSSPSAVTSAGSKSSGSSAASCSSTDTHADIRPPPPLERVFERKVARSSGRTGPRRHLWTTTLPVDDSEPPSPSAGRSSAVTAQIARAVLDRYGTTFAEEAGIRLADEPAPLFQLLVLAELLSARIGTDIAVAAAVELRTAGLTTPRKMRDSPRQARIAALGRARYRRYDERTATQLGEAAQLVL